MNRRDMLKLFGAGAVIAPVVEGSVVASVRATLIEIPKVEVVEALPLFENCFPSNPYTGRMIRLLDPVPFWIHGKPALGHVVELMSDMRYGYADAIVKFKISVI